MRPGETSVTVKYAIKTGIADPKADSFTFCDEKTMYGGKEIAVGDTIFLFASENEGGAGLVACGVVMSAESTPRKPGVARQTPRVSIAVRRTALAKRRLGHGDARRRRRDGERLREPAALQRPLPHALPHDAGGAAQDGG